MGDVSFEPTTSTRLHEHDQVPSEPEDGDRFVCSCGYSAEFVVLDDGLPGEWVSG